MWNFVNFGANCPADCGVDQARSKRWSVSVSASVAGHVLIAAILCWPVAPIFVKPNLIAHGDGGSATPVSITLYIPPDIKAAAQSQPSQLSLPAQAQEKSRTRPVKRKNVLESDKKEIAAEAGSTKGSYLDGPAFGDEVKPALPMTFADPPVGRWDIPVGVQGDVIVEITIDVQGNVVEEKLLQGIGYGVDEKIIAALRDWRFRPATRNGIAIPSKHDVHFHFPS